MKISKENDNIIKDEKDSIIVEQKLKEAFLSYSVEGLFNSKNKPFSKLFLKFNPPVLRIKDSNDNQIAFFLTKKFNNKLLKTISLVDKVYNGESIEEKVRLKDLFKGEWWKLLRVDVVLFFIIIILLIIDILVKRG